MTPSQGLFSNNSNSSSYVGVPQHGYAITTADSPRPVVFTCGISSCFVVTLYEKEKKMGALAHLDQTEQIKETVDNIVNPFRLLGSLPGEIEAQMIGGIDLGDGSQKKLHSDITNHLLSRGLKIIDHTFNKSFSISDEESMQIETLSTQLVQASPDEKESINFKINEILKKTRYTQIALDTRTGELFHSSELVHLVETPLQNSAYSLASQKLIMKLDKAVSDLLEGNPYSTIEIINSPLKKVFDATNKKNYYPG